MWAALLNGAQADPTGAGASVHPTTLQATGTGWVLGVGRIGAILGPLAGGGLIAADFAPERVFTFAAAPALVTATAVLLLARRRRHGG